MKIASVCTLECSCLVDDLCYEGAEASCCCWLSEGDHGTDGELYKINGRRCVSVFCPCLCVLLFRHVVTSNS